MGGIDGIRGPLPRTHTSYTGPTGMQPEGGLMEILENFETSLNHYPQTDIPDVVMEDGAFKETYDQIIQWVSEQVIGENEKHVSGTGSLYLENGRNALRAEQRARLHSNEEAV